MLMGCECGIGYCGTWEKKVYFESVHKFDSPAERGHQTSHSRNTFFLLLVADNFLCASATETRFSITAESKAMLYIPLQRNTM